jgi:hypothetical protein
MTILFSPLEGGGPIFVLRMYIGPAFYQETNCVSVTLPCSYNQGCMAEHFVLGIDVHLLVQQRAHCRRIPHPGCLD